MVASTSRIRFPVPGSKEPGTAAVVRPDGAGPFPGVVVLHEMLGLNDDMERIAARFADEGYLAMAPDYFGDGFRPFCIARVLRDVKAGSGPTFERIDAARRWLSANDDVAGDRLAVAKWFLIGGDGGGEAI